jgi:hypothetical protein
MGFAALATPVAAQAAEVDLGTAHPFSVLGGSTVTNTGTTNLAGDLGVSPGAVADVGTLNQGGARYELLSPVSLQAQTDLTTAYNTAANEASSANLSGQNVGARTLTAGTYTYSSSAIMTGQLTLDAQGDPASRWIFQIGSDLTTASNSSVLLTNGASPCNVYWQVGSSATLGTDTDFVGTIMADQSITTQTGTTVLGRALARIAAVNLDANTFVDPGCARGGTTTQGTPPTSATATPTGSSPTSGNQPPPGSQSTAPTKKGSSRLVFTPNARPGRVPRSGPRSRCTSGFTARVRGKLVKSVVFSIDGKRIANRTRSPFQVSVKARGGKHRVSARVSYRDATRAKTMSVAYRGCAAAVLQPRRGPSQFTG